MGPWKKEGEGKMVRWVAFVIIAIFIVLGQYTIIDIANAVSYYGEKISTTHPSLGSFVFLFAVGFVLFTDNFLSFVRKRRKVKLKQKF